MASIPEQIREKVKLGELSPTHARDLLHKDDICDRIKKIYRHIAKSSTSRFSADALRPANIKVISWNAETPDSRKPKFFQQMSPDTFRSCEMPRFKGIHKLLDPRSFTYSAELALENCMGNLQPPPHEHKSLIELGGWKFVKYNSRSFAEIGDLSTNSDEKYQWQADHIFGQKTMPHTNILSSHYCEEPTHILRSELMIVLLAMWEIGRKGEWLYDEVIPVLQVSIRNYQFHVIEAYYDGSAVIVRYSDPIPMNLTDSTEKQKRVMDLVLRWMVSTPIGETKSFSSIPKDEPMRGGP
ncbi:hypothetical protein FQN54_005920 [Arachnomyces sp. PD_36]|nr:hypothetical protein FQN54_005920 [Arachnomyces sp. PD_36]